MTQLSAAETARIDDLVTEFTKIGDERMRDLGLYNKVLSVEAVGFRVWDGWLTGILVTPWFMNFMLLPTVPGQLEDAATGSKRRIKMPCGEVVFTIGEVDGIGAYAASSLFSPMRDFNNQMDAAARAWVAVEKFFQEPAASEAPACGS